MRVEEIIAVVEEFAPVGLQEEYDNAGLIVGAAGTDVAGAVVCVDVTEDVVDEAVRLGAGLVVAHHPVIFRPLKALNGRTNVEKVVMKAVRENVAIYAAHTNLDRAWHGMSWWLAGRLGLREIEVLDPEEKFGLKPGDGEGHCEPSVKTDGNIKFDAQIETDGNIEFDARIETDGNIEGDAQIETDGNIEFDAQIPTAILSLTPRLNPTAILRVTRRLDSGRWGIWRPKWGRWSFCGKWRGGSVWGV